jgi:hypothetical protein
LSNLSVFISIIGKRITDNNTKPFGIACMTISFSPCSLPTTCRRSMNVMGSGRCVRRKPCYL